MEDKYSVVVGTFSLPGYTGHLTIGVVDGSGGVMYEVDGLATDKYGSPKPIGMPWDFTDTIKAYIID